jgi:hypothetical protein
MNLRKQPEKLFLDCLYLIRREDIESEEDVTTLGIISNNVFGVVESSTISTV